MSRKPLPQVKGCKSKGFSSLEILVVMTAIGLLAALLLPVLRRTREEAAQSNCVFNLRQLGTGWLQYNRDYDQKIMRFSTSEPGKTVYWWGSFDGKTLKTSEGLLRPYFKGAKVEECPQFKNNTRAVMGSTGFAYNSAYLSPSSWGPGPDYEETPRVVAMEQIASPAETVVMADSARISVETRDTILESNAYLGAPRSAYPTFHGRHDGSGNVLWADGHVSSAKPVYRGGGFGFEGDGPYFGEQFEILNLGDLDRDGDLQTNELFDLK